MSESQKWTPPDLPTRCECGGNLEYVFAFGRTFSVCDRCTPAVRVPGRCEHGVGLHDWCSACYEDYRPARREADDA